MWDEGISRCLGFASQEAKLQTLLLSLPSFPPHSQIHDDACWSVTSVVRELHLGSYLLCFQLEVFVLEWANDFYFKDLKCVGSEDYLRVSVHSFCNVGFGD